MVFIGKYKILRTKITACDYEFILNEVRGSIKKKKILLVSPSTTHMLVKAYFDKNIRKVMDNFDYVVPDSFWLTKSINFLYGKYLAQRVYGPRLMLEICDLASKNEYKIFLLGHKNGVLKILKKVLEKKYPGIQVVGFSNKPPLLADELDKVKPDVLFVGLGSPKQDVFSYKFLKEVYKKPLVIVPVGAAFDFITGVKSMAPTWIQNIGFEWLFRLVKEPKRLWRRYLFSIPTFLLLVTAQKFQLILKSIGGNFGSD